MKLKLEVLLLILLLHLTGCSTSLSIGWDYCCDRSATSVNKLGATTVGKQTARHCECLTLDVKCRGLECAFLFGVHIAELYGLDSFLCNTFFTTLQAPVVGPFCFL